MKTTVLMISLVLAPIGVLADLRVSPAKFGYDGRHLQDACEDSKECGVGKYCSAGQCRDNGSCETEWDCRNPNNFYPVIECTGPLICSSQACGRICGEPCLDGTSGVRCPSDSCASAESSCSRSFTSCQNYSCGGCFALVFDDAGNHEFCIDQTPSTPDEEASVVYCSSTLDCQAEEYCSSGTCVQGGTCSSDADCFNPENIYFVIECVGPISCGEQGQCGRTCAGSFCPEDKPTVECLVSPCEVLSTSCNEKIANCVDNYCGDCGVYAFDAAGNQVCDYDDTKLCSSSEECADDEYCAGGECLINGSCINDLDCFNPSNSYGIAACVGLLSCSEQGTCGIECGDSFCPEGSIEAFCPENPCDSVPTCKEDWKYCIQDTCDGDCDFILFDAAGNEVECTPLASCSSTLDCQADEYCSSGTCVQGGTCSSDADCFNPENIYPVIECVGPISCGEQGQCGRTCAGSFCPEDKPTVECLVSPCEVLSTSCNEKIANCVDNYCEDCGVYAFDAAGNRVCHSGDSDVDFEIESESDSTPETTGDEPVTNSNAKDQASESGAAIRSSVLMMASIATLAFIWRVV